MLFEFFRTSSFCLALLQQSPWQPGNQAYLYSLTCLIPTSQQTLFTGWCSAGSAILLCYQEWCKGSYTMLPMNFQHCAIMGKSAMGWQCRTSSLGTSNLTLAPFLNFGVLNFWILTLNWLLISACFHLLKTH